MAIYHTHEFTVAHPNGVRIRWDTQASAIDMAKRWIARQPENTTAWVNVIRTDKAGRKSYVAHFETLRR